MAAVKKIGVLTSGGDAPGMNAAVRSVVRTAVYNGIEVMGIRKGYNGLINGDIFEMNARSVSETLQRGGTILQTARCKEFCTTEGVQRGAEIAKIFGLDGLVVIGGDGSFRGARDLAKVGVKKLSEFNSRPVPAEQEFDDDGKPIPAKMPLLVIILDELADLMMTEAKKDVETNITRIAQKGRAAGIHIIVATQRPSTNIITGVIKANLPTRLCFQVRSLIDSRVVLDTPGAEKLLGMGDMLVMTSSSMEIERVQGAWVKDDDIKKVVQFISEQAPQRFDDNVLVSEDAADGEDIDDDYDAIDPEDQADIQPLIKKYMRPGDDDTMRRALEIVVLDRKASTSYLQRRLRIGYNRAAELIDQMEERGIVGPPSGSGSKRDILIFDGCDIGE